MQKTIIILSVALIISVLFSAFMVLNSNSLQIQNEELQKENTDLQDIIEENEIHIENLTKILEKINRYKYLDESP